ncbi:MAG: YlmC/YmxH family sporulation protein [Acutalibacteraceae bacterium]|nr:YlmC/YmxH family sporulation protein [Acutalibacteraceae bacterium]
MIYNVADFKNKQVVSTETGAVMGYVGELEIDTDTGSVANIVIFGKQRLYGILGREEDIIIPWGNIEVIGDETVLIKGPVALKNSNRKSL